MLTLNAGGLVNCCEQSGISGTEILGPNEISPR